MKPSTLTEPLHINAEGHRLVVIHPSGTELVVQTLEGQVLARFSNVAGRPDVQATLEPQPAPAPPSSPSRASSPRSRSSRS